MYAVSVLRPMIYQKFLDAQSKAKEQAIRDGLSPEETDLFLKAFAKGWFDGVLGSLDLTDPLHPLGGRLH